MGNWWLVIVLAGGLGAWTAVARNRQRIAQLRSETVALRVDALGVGRELADGREESVEWADIVLIEVFSANKGPHAPAGGALVLYGAEGGCIVPLERVPSSGVLDRLGILPGFDLAQFTVALERAEARPHHPQTVWRKDGG